MELFKITMNLTINILLLRSYKLVFNIFLQIPFAYSILKFKSRRDGILVIKNPSTT